MINIPVPTPRPQAEKSRAPRPVIKTGTYTLELFKADTFRDEKFGDAALGFQKLRFFFRVLNGPPKNETPAEVEAATLRGYGLVFSLDIKPVYVGPRTKADGTTTQASNLYEFLKTWNGGDSADEYVVDEQPAVQAENLSKLLNSLVAKRTQFSATIKRENVKGEFKNTFSVGNLIEALAPEDYLPRWEYVRAVDPREEGDDPNIKCEDTGVPIHGFQGTDGKWITNVEAAEISKRKWGKVLCPAEIHKLKAAAAAVQAAASAAARRVVNAPQDIDDSDLPF